MRRTSSATEIKNFGNKNDENSFGRQTREGKGINVSYDNENKIVIRNAHDASFNAPNTKDLQAVNIYDIYKDASASDDAVKKDKGVKTVEESAKRLFNLELSYSGWHRNLHQIFDKVHNSLKDFEQEVVFERYKVAVERLPCYIYFNESGIFGDRVSFNPGAIIKIQNGAQTFDPGPGGGEYRFPPNGDALFFEPSFMNMYGFPGQWAWGCRWDKYIYTFQANINGYSNIDSNNLKEDNHYWTFGNATKNKMLNDGTEEHEVIDKIVACKALGDAMQNATYLTWFYLMSAYESVEAIYDSQIYDNYEKSFDTNAEKDAVKKWLTYNSIMMTSDETVHYRNKLFGLPSAFTGGKRDGSNENDDTSNKMTLNVGKVFVPATDPKQKLKFLVDMEAQSVIKELTAQKMNWLKMIIEHNDVKTIDGRLVFHKENSFEKFNNDVENVPDIVNDIMDAIKNIKDEINNIIDGLNTELTENKTQNIMLLIQTYIQDQICCPFVMVARTGWMIQEPYNYNPTYWGRIEKGKKRDRSFSPQISRLITNNSNINDLYRSIGDCIKACIKNALVPRASKRNQPNQNGGKTKKKTRKHRKQKKRKTRRKLYKGGFYGEKQSDKVNYDKKLTDNEKYILGLIHLNLELIKKQIKIQIENDTDDYDDDDTFNLEYGTYCNVLSYLNKNRNNVLLNKKVIDFKEKVEKSLLTVIYNDKQKKYENTLNSPKNDTFNELDNTYNIFEIMFEHFEHVSNIEELEINNKFKNEYIKRSQNYAKIVKQSKENAQLKQANAQHERTNAQLKQANAQHERTNAQLKQANAQHERTNAQLSQKNAQHERTNAQLSQKNAQHEQTIAIQDDTIGRLAQSQQTSFQQPNLKRERPSSQSKTRKKAREQSPEIDTTFQNESPFPAAFNLLLRSPLGSKPGTPFRSPTRSQLGSPRWLGSPHGRGP
jgi:hypothetical protein